MRLKQKGRGFDPHSGRSVVSLSKIGLGSTHFMILIRVNKCLSTHFGIGGGGEGRAVADPEGVEGVRSNPPLVRAVPGNISEVNLNIGWAQTNPPLELNYFIFMGNFKKNEATLRKHPPPLSEFEPPIQKSLIRSWGGGVGLHVRK